MSFFDKLKSTLGGKNDGPLPGENDSESGIREANEIRFSAKRLEAFYQTDYPGVTVAVTSIIPPIMEYTFQDKQVGNHFMQERDALGKGFTYTSKKGGLRVYEDRTVSE